MNMYVYTYIYIYTYIHIYTYTYIHIYICTFFCVTYLTEVRSQLLTLNTEKLEKLN